MIHSSRPNDHILNKLGKEPLGDATLSLVVSNKKIVLLIIYTDGHKKRYMQNLRYITQKEIKALTAVKIFMYISHMPDKQTSIHSNNHDALLKVMVMVSSSSSCLRTTYLT